MIITIIIMTIIILIIITIIITIALTIIIIFGSDDSTPEILLQCPVGAGAPAVPTPLDGATGRDRAGSQAHLGGRFGKIPWPALMGECLWPSNQPRIQYVEVPSDNSSHLTHLTQFSLVQRNSTMNSLLC